MLINTFVAHIVSLPLSLFLYPFFPFLSSFSLSFLSLFPVLNSWVDGRRCPAKELRGRRRTRSWHSSSSSSSSSRGGRTREAGTAAAAAAAAWEEEGEREELAKPGPARGAAVLVI
jgi:hypothetical protein